MRSMVLLLAVACTSTATPQRPPPGVTPWLTLSPFVPGTNLQIRIEGAQPREMVQFWMGDSQVNDGGDCPPTMGGQCVDLGGNTRILLQRRADANGVVDTAIGPIPNLLGRTACFQAVAERGVDTAKGNVWCDTIGNDSDGDGVDDASDICDGDDWADADGDGIPDACDPLNVSDRGLFLHLDAEVGVTEAGGVVSAWADQSGLGNDLTLLTGGPLLDGSGDNAMVVFDGDDGLSRTGGFATGDYSKVVTFSLDAVASNNLFSSGSGGHALYYATSPNARLWHSGAFVIADRATDLQQTTTVVVTYDASTRVGTLYQDGVMLGQGTRAVHTNYSMQVGSHNGANHLTGRIAEIRGYDRVLSGEEVGLMQEYVDARYHGGEARGMRFLGPVGWYDAADAVVSEGEAVEWPDRSGNGLDLAQSNPNRWPQYLSRGMDGRAALYFSADRLYRDDGFPTGSYTKAAVFRPNRLGPAWTNNVFSSEGTGHALYYGGSRSLRLWHGGRAIRATNLTGPDETVVALATWDAATGEGVLYQNGAEVARGAMPAHDMFGISAGAHGDGYFFEGQIAELMAFDEVLDEGELQAVNRHLLTSVGLYEAPDTTEVFDIPQTLRVYARDNTDTCYPAFTGVASGGASSAVQVDVYRDGVFDSTVSEPLVRLNGEAQFEISAPIGAGLHDYELVLSIRSSTGLTELARTQDIACGDLILVAGQSNAEARLFNNEVAEVAAYESRWARTYGNSLDNASAMSDMDWDFAQARTSRSHAAAGQWGLMLADDIIQSEGVAVGVLNGARGGTTIAANSRNDADPTDANTIYGRMLTRAQRSGMDQAARAMFWYQGESDGSNTAAYYAGAFDELRADWLEDYGALEHIYVVQVRSGCGGVTRVREAMRTLPDTHPDVQVMSTTGLTGHDGCHYRHIGYRELADRLFGLLDHDLYGAPYDPAAEAPNVVSAALTGTQEVTLTFEPAGTSLTWEAGSEAYFQLSDGTGVSSGSASGNTVVLQLSAVPGVDADVHYIGHTLDGPWVLNSRGIGLLTFYDIPID